VAVILILTNIIIYVLRHHTIRNMMAEDLRDYGYTVYKETCCKNVNDASAL
ncbi:hypothetical protein L9F63_008501, partial [Diploptera punctata]